jgi:hypothetical protein
MRGSIGISAVLAFALSSGVGLAQSVTVVTGDEAQAAEDAARAATDPGSVTPQATEQVPVDPQLAALRQQVTQQSEQLQLQQQQLAAQSEQTQQLQDIDGKVQGVQQQVYAGQVQVAGRDAARNQTLARLDTGIDAMREVDQALASGAADVDLTPLETTLPGQARVYLDGARLWLAAGDYYSARQYIGLALATAAQAREAGTALIPGQ